MLSLLHLLFLLLVSSSKCSNINAAPSQVPKPEQELPHELLSEIAHLTDNETSFMLGCASKEFNKICELRNRHNRLLRIKQYCGVEKYLELTSNGYFLFSNSIYTAPVINYRVLDTLRQETYCNHALTSNIRDIKQRLTQLTISLPGFNAAVSSPVNSAIVSYFQSIEALIKYKSNFQRVVVIVASEWRPSYLPEILEEWLLKILSSISIDELIIRANLRRPNMLINPTIMKLSARGDFFRGLKNLLNLPNLQSVTITSFSSTQTAILKIAQSLNVKELKTPWNLVSKALSQINSIEKLGVYGSFHLGNQDYLTSLMKTTKPLKGLYIDWHVCSSVSDVSPFLQKFKPTLETLSLFIDLKYEYSLWINLLELFLHGNKVIKDLSINVICESEFNHSFLSEAEHLNSYSFSGELLSGSHLKSLFDFISSHKSLKTLSLDFVNFVSETDFFAFYDKLVASIRTNLSITTINFQFLVDFLDFESFAKMFSEKTRPLMGRDLIYNTIPIKNIVLDLAFGLEETLDGRKCSTVVYK